MSKIVCIDAGHGGKDSGATFRDIREKDITLIAAKRVRDLLLVCRFIAPVMTREEDVYVSLEDRVKIANDSKADYFLSIHVNAAGKPGDTTTAAGEELWVAKGDKKSLQYGKIFIDWLDMVFEEDPHRGVKEGNLYVNKYTKMPSALIELGFINNPKSYAYFSSPYKIHTMSFCLMIGILNVIHEIYKEGRK